MVTVGYICFRATYKYQLANSYTIEIPIKPRSNIETEFIDLDTNDEEQKA